MASGAVWALMLGRASGLALAKRYGDGLGSTVGRGAGPGSSATLGCGVGSGLDYDLEVVTAGLLAMEMTQTMGTRMGVHCVAALEETPEFGSVDWSALAVALQMVAQAMA